MPKHLRKSHVQVLAVSNDPDIRTEYDVIVVGSGAAGLTAACVSALQGCSVLLLEQSAKVGGTTAISGGMVWIPNNHKMAGAGREDSLHAAREYLSALVQTGTPERLDAFLKYGDQAVRYLESHTALRLQPVVTYPDYYPDLPGATLGGRVLEPEPYDALALGKNFKRLQDPLPEFLLWDGMMISRQDLPHLRRAFKSMRSALYVARLLLRHAWQRMRAHRGSSLYLGNALAGRLFQSALDLRVDIRTSSSVLGLLRVDGAVVGAMVAQAGGVQQKIKARKGVILATGGLSHDAALRRNYVPAHAGHLSATLNSGTAPRGAQLAKAAGAAFSA
ncbi:FAD-dependent oxidoreductase, partial [Acidovorax cavernicola]|uniref:FAD-dependent oxidoreductase n=1 Tax=Acidovorax cavernicola TaxID=1675792 RepID=UPI00197AAC20